jgi:hypothetical protein
MTVKGEGGRNTIPRSFFEKKKEGRGPRLAEKIKGF